MSSGKNSNRGCAGNFGSGGQDQGRGRGNPGGRGQQRGNPGGRGQQRENPGGQGQESENPGGRPKWNGFGGRGQFNQRSPRGNGNSSGFTVVQIASQNLPPNDPQVRNLILEKDHGGMGWKDELLKPPPAKEKGTVEDRQVRVVVNHLPVKIKPKNSVFYHYDVLMETSFHCKVSRKQAKMENGKAAIGNGAEQADAPNSNLWTKILLKVIQIIEDADPPGPLPDGTVNPILATDGSKAIYTAYPIKRMIEGDNTRSFQIDVSDLKDGNQESYDVIVRLVKVEEITDGIKDFLLDMQKHFKSGGGGNEAPEKLADLTRIFSTALRTQALRTDDHIQVGSSNFFPIPKGDGFSLKGGLVNWTGYSLTCTMGWKPFVTVDTANSVFILGKRVLDVVEEVLKANPEPEVFKDDVTTWSSRTFKNLELILLGTKVTYKALNGKPMQRKITGLCRTTAKDSKFTLEAGGGDKTLDTNVEDYFGANRLSFKKGLCLQFGHKAIVPAELCEIMKGQPYKRKMSDGQTSLMIKDTAKRPWDRLHAIENTIEAMHLKNNKVLNEFGFEIEDEKTLARITARVLPVPSLEYQDRLDSSFSRKVTPAQDGTWNSFRNCDSFQFKNPFQKPNNQPTRFGIVNFAIRNSHWSQTMKTPYIDSKKTKVFITLLADKSRELGLRLEDPAATMAKYHEMKPEEFSKFLADHKNDLKENEGGVIKFDFILVILPSSDKNVYSMVKSESEITKCGKECSVLTQCVQPNTVDSRNSATVGNIVLKLNMKLGGFNYILMREVIHPKIDILTVPTLILGADVTHPAAGSSLPSIAAVTASLDRTGMPFRAHIQAQSIPTKGAAEVIIGLDEIVREMLVLFLKKTEYFPRRIIMYRDGVGNSQFDEVLDKEMMKMRDACGKFWNWFVTEVKPEKRDKVLMKNGLTLSCDYRPKITFVAVQKRHKTRMFLETLNEKGERIKVENAPAGTVVDTDIVNPANIDFYLLSHIGIQGTSRPTRYQVLHDDSDYSMDELELLTYYLCFCYARCTRSVSYPAPTYYAHLAAFRGRIFMDYLINTEGRTANEAEEVNRFKDRIIRTDKLLKNTPMHYI